VPVIRHRRLDGMASYLAVIMMGVQTSTHVT